MGLCLEFNGCKLSNTWEMQKEFKTGFFNNQSKHANNELNICSKSTSVDVHLEKKEMYCLILEVNK
jgi:hypothetical protein